ncbi:hypothetical protein [Streptomyces avidinii]|uniref:Uncharacterized protein n=1 Tax=Streptomyces avidinii TaxID=1895 RepID=A0ABS4KZI5_STRAV|nr:hypothetical protein [Streptomyces avidinii]MBP2034791.1 hypothetical protein [Streptomyces avidinii]
MTTTDVTSSSDADAPRHGHRFLLIGTDTIFAYHLPLYHVAVHAFQMITKFGLDGSLRKKYLNDLGNHEDRQVYYSLFSEGHWPLKEIVDGTRTALKVELERVTVDSTGARTFTKILDETTPPAASRTSSTTSLSTPPPTPSTSPTSPSVRVPRSTSPTSSPPRRTGTRSSPPQTRLASSRATSTTPPPSPSRPSRTRRASSRRALW